jgi:hypothetical protein
MPNITIRLTATTIKISIDGLIADRVERSARKQLLGKFTKQLWKSSATMQIRESSRKPEKKDTAKGAKGLSHRGRGVGSEYLIYFPHL